MNEPRQYQARTLEVALSKAARDLGVPMEAVRYLVLFDGRKGLFGFGQRDIIIRVDVDETEKAKSAPRGQAGATPGHHPLGPVGEMFPQEKRQFATGSGGMPREEHEQARLGERKGDPPGRQGGRREEGHPREPEPGTRRPGRSRGDTAGQARRTDLPEREGQWPPRPAHESVHRPQAPAIPPKTPQGLALLALAEKLIAGMHLDLECVVHDATDDLVLELRGMDERLVIGRHGEVLDALQYLVNRLLSRDASLMGRRVFVDSADYRTRHERDIEERARRTAKRVRETGEAVELEPMNPSQRRIVHLTLHDEPGVKTYSTGEGFLRRLVIAPTD